MGRVHGGAGEVEHAGRAQLGQQQLVQALPDPGFVPLPQPVPDLPRLARSPRLGLLAAGSAAEAGLPDLPAARISRTVTDLLKHQPGCAHPVSDGFAVSLLAPVLLTAGHDAAATACYLTDAAAWTLDCYDVEYGGAGLASTFAAPETEVAWLLGSAFENGPHRRPWSYIATVLADLSAVIPGTGALYEVIVNDFLAVDASPVLVRADERRAQWRPDGQEELSLQGLPTPNPSRQTASRPGTSPTGSRLSLHGTRWPWPASPVTGTSCERSARICRVDPSPIQANVRHSLHCGQVLAAAS